MLTQTVRTTVDLPRPLLTQVKRQAVERGETIKKVITEAVERYVVSGPKPSAKALLREFSQLAKFGRQDVDLGEFLRRDRDTHI